MQLTKEFEKPYTERAYPLLPPGTYGFVVEHAELHTSKKNKISIKVQLSFVKDNDFSQKFTVFDYLGTEPAWKFRSFLRAVGLEELEQLPTIEPYQLRGASGIAKLRIDKSEEYDDKNTVQAYKVKEGVAKAVPAPVTSPQTQQASEAAFINQAQKDEAKEAAHSDQAKINDEDIPF